MGKYVVFFLATFLTACGGLPPAPEMDPKFVDTEVTAFPCHSDSTGKLSCNEEITLPISSVKGHYCLSGKDLAAARRWAKDVKDNYTCKRK